MGKYNRTFKMLDVIAEKQVQVVAEKRTPFEAFDPPAFEMLDPVVAVVFERAVLLSNKIIIQGYFNINKIYKSVYHTVNHIHEIIKFSTPVELPGFHPITTIGPGKKVVACSDIINIGPGNQATANGLDIQLYIKSLLPVQIMLLEGMNGFVEQKIILDFLIKVSKFEQVSLKLPAPDTVFEFRHVMDC